MEPVGTAGDEPHLVVERLDSGVVDPSRTAARMPSRWVRIVPASLTSGCRRLRLALAHQRSSGSAASQALGALEQYPAGALEPLGLGRVHSAQLVPDLAADLIERVGGELDHVERVDAHGRLGGVPGLATDFKKAGPMSVDTVVSRAARSAPSSAKNRSKAAVSLPSAPQATLPLRWSVTSVR